MKKPMENGDQHIVGNLLDTYFPPISVLTYHNIVDNGQENPNDIHSISIERLNEHLQALAAAGYVQVSLPDAFDILVHSKKYELGYALTFDDGYQSLWKFRKEIASPLQPTLFIVTEYTGSSTLSWNTRSSTVLDHLKLNEIRRLMECGFDIQMHGLDHHNLLKFSDRQLQNRFRSANDWFHEKIGKPVEYLAYPYGYCDQRIQKIASEFYKGAVSVSHGVWAGKLAQYVLNRVSIPYYLTGSELIEVLRKPPEDRWLEMEKKAPWRKS